MLRDMSTQCFLIILDSFVQGTGIIAAQLRYNTALRNAAQIGLVPLMQAQLKARGGFPMWLARVTDSKLASHGLVQDT